MVYQRLTIAAMVAAVALPGCGQGGQQHGPLPLNVDVAAAQRRAIATYVTLDGQVAPLEQSTLSFQQSGPITAIYVNVGDIVHSGELVATIDASTLRAQLAQAAAAAEQQNATAQGARVGLPVQQTQNTTAVSTARAALANAKLAYDQDVELFKQGYASQSQLESARSTYVAAKSQYDNAQIGLNNTTVSEQNVKASVAGAQAARAQADVLRTQISQTSLYAPFSGVVTQRLMDPGSMASPSTPVLAISRVDTVWVNINVPDEDLPYVHAGTNVSFSSTSLPGKMFHGAITTVNAVPTQGTLSYLARIQLPNPSDVLRGGMLVTATLPKQVHDRAIVVPRAAVAQTENGDVVFVVNGNKAEQVPVRVGIQTDTLAEVTSPRVQAGSQVITTRPDALRDGSLVAVNTSANTAPNGGTSQ